MAVVMSTDSVTPSDRLRFWRQVVLDCFNVDCTIDADPVSFRQSMSFRQLGPLSILEQEGSPLSASQFAAGKDCLVIVVIPLAGRGTVRVDGSTVPLAVGSFCAYHSCKVTGLAYDSTYRHLVLTCPSIHLVDRIPEWECDTPLILSATEGVGILFVELVHSLAQHEECLSESCRQEAINLTLALLSSAVKNHGTFTGTHSPSHPLSLSTHMQSYHRKRIRQLALSRLNDADLDVPQIAAAVGLSVPYIHRLFANEPLSLMRWIYEERLNRCYRDLINPEQGNHSISKIAYTWGFNSPSHFCRAFQKCFNLTPSELRTQLKNFTGEAPDQSLRVPRTRQPD